MRIDHEELKRVIEFLDLGHPVHAEVIKDVARARNLGVRDKDHAIHAYDVDGKRHVILLNAPSFGRCSHNPNVSALHELVHAWQVERHPGGPEAQHRDYLEQEQEYGYRENPYEIEAEDGGLLLDRLGFEVVRP